MTPASRPRSSAAATFTELLGVIQAHRRRQARELDAMAWTVAHLLVGGGTLRKGTRVDALMRDLLGRAPGTRAGRDAPAEPPPSRGAVARGERRPT